MICIFCKAEITPNPSIGSCSNCGLSQSPRMLVDWEIEKLLNMNIIKIMPTLNLKNQLNPSGLDITLDTRFKKVVRSNTAQIDPMKPYNSSEYYQDVELLLSNKQNQFVLHPGEFVLGQTFEYVSIPDFITGGLDGKSSLGRLGLMVHTTAASVDPGFKGHITLELFNNGGLPIILHPLMPIGRLIFHVASKARQPYDGQYAGQTEVRPSKAFEGAFAKILRDRPDSLP
jgi:dCTP deaminase